MINNAVVGDFTRFEVIDHRTSNLGTARALGIYEAVNVKLAVQDDGQTLKLFLADGRSDDQVDSRRGA